MRIRTLCILCLSAIFLASSPVAAKQLVGEGYGKTDEEAKKQALMDLSSIIQVQVQCEVSSISRQVDKEFYSDVKQAISVKSDLPILGAAFEYRPAKKERFARVVLDPKALPLYEEKLREAVKGIDAVLKTADNTADPNRKYELLNDALSLIDGYYKYKIVAMMLGCLNMAELKVTEAEIKSRLKRLETDAETLELALSLVAKGVDRKGVYVYPPTTRDSHEVTQLGSAIKDKLSVLLDTVQAPSAANCVLRSEYEILKDGIELTCHLVDKDASTIMTRVVRLAPKAYQGYRYQPQTVSFDKLLYEGVAVSSDFRVELSTNKGGGNLVFKADEEVELLVKANRPGYFYIVGHIVKEQEKYSYLVQLSTSVLDNRKFIYFINADDVNKWVSIGQFGVSAPYGVESIQLVASSEDLISRLPAVESKTVEGLHLISKNPERGIAKTRGLVPKKQKEVVSAEAVLMFTTIGATK